MRFSSKKLLVVGAALIFSATTVSAVWLARGAQRLVYSASYKSPALTAEFNRSPADWQETVRERQAAGRRPERIQLTEELGKAALAEYLLNKKNNSVLNEEQIAQKILSAYGFEEISRETDFREYRLTDLKIRPDGSAESLRRYGNDLGRLAAEKARDPKLGNELEILNQAISLNRDKEFEKLKPIVKDYDDLIQAMLKLETPAILADSHLQLVNNWSRTKAAVENFPVFMTDPLRGIFIISNFAAAGLDFQDALRQINSELKERGVVFAKDEAGFLIERAADFKAET